MKRMMLTVFVLGLFVLGVFPEARGLNAQTNGTHVSTFLQNQVAGMSGKEWKVVTIALSPGAVDSRSVHPGVGLVYVLEGGGILQLDGNVSLALHPGVAAVLNPEKPHVLKNTSETETLRILVVVHDEKENRVAKKQSSHQGLGF